MFEKSADLGSSKAALELSKMHKLGLGGPKDLSKAERYEKQSIEISLKDLAAEISSIGLGGANVIPKVKFVIKIATEYEMQIPPASDQAKGILDQIVYLGISDAYERFASSLFEERHKLHKDPADLAKARELLEKSADLGHKEAALEAYQMCKNGQGGPVDLIKAAQFEKQFIEAELKELSKHISDVGVAIAAKSIDFGFVIEYEKENPPASDKAKSYLDKVSALGIPNVNQMFAKELYDLAFKLRYESPQDLDKARYLFEKSALLGSKNGAFEISMMCKRGLGGSVDLTKAAQFEKQYIEEQFKELSIRFADIGTVHTIASNIPRSEAAMAYGEYAPEVKAKHAEYLDTLRKQGILTPTETMPYYDSRDGICAGMSTEFLIDAMSADPAKERSATFLRTAQARQGRPGVTATAIHTILEGIYKKSIVIPPRHFTVKSSDPTDMANRIADHAVHHSHLSRFYKYHSLNLTPVKEMGSPGSKNDKECIDELMQSHHPDGWYKVIITTGLANVNTGKNITHSMVMCKEKGKLKVWDPSYIGFEPGTAKMATPEAVAQYLKDAWPFPPDNNHQMIFFRAEKQETP